MSDLTAALAAVDPAWARVQATKQYAAFIKVRDWADTAWTKVQATPEPLAFIAAVGEVEALKS